MKELEKKTYIFSVEAIGWAMSMEKMNDHPNEVTSFKLAAANTYKYFSSAVVSEENQAFADKLRDSLNAAKEAEKLLDEISTENEELAKQQKALYEKSGEIVSELEEITKKIIY
ncbi:MAG: hypothetical protein ACQESJ_04345 [Bacteroidota bacterium]